MATVVSTSTPEDSILQKGTLVSHTEDAAVDVSVEAADEADTLIHVTEEQIDRPQATKEDVLSLVKEKLNLQASEEEITQSHSTTASVNETTASTDPQIDPVAPLGAKILVKTEASAKAEVPVESEVAVNYTEIDTALLPSDIDAASTSTGIQNRQETIEAAPLLTEDSTSPFTHVETVALVVRKPKDDFKIETIFLDEVRDDEVLIDMKYSGICHTDIVFQQGLLPMVEFPAIFGHEGAGYILSIGSKVKNKDLKIGDAVLLSFNTCGTCKPCLDHHPAYCINHPEVNHNAVRLSDRTTPASLPDGQSVRSQYFGQSSFAKKSIVNEKCVVKCPYPDKMDIYAPMGCGFQTGAGTILNVLKPGADDSLVIFGLGSVGLATLMAAKYIGCGRIIAVDIVAEKLEMAKQLGATDLINSRMTPDVVTEIKKLTGRGATQAVDCTGVLKVIEDMIDSIGPLGTAVTVGVPPPGAKIRLDPLQFMLDNKKYIGIIEGDSNPVEFIPKLMEMHQSGKFPVELLCRTYPVENLQEAIHDMHIGKVIKPVISWG